MKKIPCLFRIDHVAHVATSELNPVAVERIKNGKEIRATIKRDGTALFFDGEKWFARRQVRSGKPFPENFILEETDPNTGNSFGWEPIEASPFFKFFKNALENINFIPFVGTFELAGPKIQGGAEKTEDGNHIIFIHGSEECDFPDIQKIIDDPNIKELLLPFAEEWKKSGQEGVVLWIDGTPSVKIRAKDFFVEMNAR